MKTVPASVLINHIGKFKYWACTEIVSLRSDNPTTIATPDVVKSRESAPLELFASQKAVLQTIANPFPYKTYFIGGRVPARYAEGVRWRDGDNDAGAGGEGAGEGAAEEPKDRIVRSNRLVIPRSYPVVRILNMPTGTGKTVLSAMGMALHLRTPSVQEELKKTFPMFVRSNLLSRHGTGDEVASLVIEKNDSNLEHVFLPNAMLVHAPRHLVGAWRDTFLANRDSLGDVRVYPTSAALTLSDLPVDDIRANPDTLFVFVTHESNVQRYMVTEAPLEQDPERVSEAGPGEAVDLAKGVHPCRTKIRIFHYGGAIFDEADLFDMPLAQMYCHIPPAMYTLLVTATPNALDASSLYRLLLADRTRVDNYTSALLHPTFIPTETPYGLSAASRQLESHLKMTHNLDHLAYVMSHNVLSLQMLRELQREVAERVPPMHAYGFRTTRSIAQRLGVVDNDMGDPRAVQRRLEDSFEIQLYGKGVVAVIASLDKAVTKQRAVLAGHNCPHEDPQEARRAGGCTAAVIAQVSKLHRMLTLRRVLGESMDEPCGICFEAPDQMIFTSCCGFCVCKACHVRVVAGRMACPKCRLNHVRFASVLSPDDEQQRPAAKKRCSSAGGAEAGAGSGGVVEAPTVPKDMGAFEAWLTTFDARHSSQQEAVQAVLARARSNGITHVILAGPNVDEWGLSATEGVEGFEIVRPSGGRRTAMHLDRSYASFCSSSGAAAAASTSSPNKLLLLDTVKNNHKDLTGIDAKLTDLIIQVTDKGVNEAEYTQLMGRAMRLGRRGHAVHCLLR